MPHVIVSCQTAGTDFDGTSPLTQTFVSGSTVGDRVYFDIPIFDDDIVEKEEFFSALLNADAKIHREIAFVQITDKDSELEQTTCYHLAFCVITSLQVPVSTSHSQCMKYRRAVGL